MTDQHTITEKQLTRGLRHGKYIHTDLGLEQRCSICGSYWPADTEFFYAQGDRIASQCKACFRERTGRLAKGSQASVR